MADRLGILFAGGGTGGHLFPAIAIAEQIRRGHPEAEITFVGTRGKIEEQVVPSRGFRFERIWIAGFRRSFSLDTIIFPFRLLVSLMQSAILLRKYRPDAVVGTGGYVAGPVVYVAGLMRIPTLIQEQNSYPGVTTRLLASRANEVHLTFRESEQYFTRKDNLRYSGNPTRAGLGVVTREEGRKVFDLNSTDPVLLVFGGSQGARPINDAVRSMLNDLALLKVQIIWQTGEADFTRCRQAANGSEIAGTVRVMKFVKEMEHAYAAADLALCRAGATTIAELTRVGLPSILVPFPHAAADHQTKNAESMAASGAALVIPEKDLLRKTLPEIKRLLVHRNQLEEMAQQSRTLGSPEASAQLADAVLKLAGYEHAGGG